MQKNISIIGAGKVGSVLARYFKMQGWSIDAIISRTVESASSLARSCNAKRYSADLSALDFTSEYIMISVFDDSIISVAHQLAEHLSKKNYYPSIFHTSGIRTSDDLITLNKIGCTTFSFHPIQTFYSRTMNEYTCEHIGVGIEGDDAGINSAYAIASTLSWKPIHIKKEFKPLYHAACVFGSSFLQSLADVSSKFIEMSGACNERALDYVLPMMTTAIDALKISHPHGVLTGPIVRGDEATISQHDQAIKKFQPEFLNLYLELTRLAQTIVKQNSTSESAHKNKSIQSMKGST